MCNGDEDDNDEEDKGTVPVSCESRALEPSLCLHTLVINLPTVPVGILGSDCRRSLAPVIRL